MLLTLLAEKEMFVKVIPHIRGEWMIMCDKRGRVTSLSRNVMESCGLAESDISGLKAPDLMRRCLGVSLDEYPDIYGIIKNGDYHEERLVLHGSDGGRRIVDMSVVPAIEESGAGALFVCSFRDITEHCNIEEILERYAQGLTILYEISASFLSDAGMGVIMDEVLDMIRSYYGSDVVHVLVPCVNGDSGKYELLAASGSDARPGQRISLSDDSIEGNCLKRRCPVVATDLSSGGDVSRAEFMGKVPAGSGIGVPMISGGKMHGVLSILYHGPRQIDTAELWYLNVLSNILSVFIEKQRSFARLTESEKFLHSVLEGIGEGVVVVNPQMKIVSANRGYLDIVGLDIGDVIGQSYFRVSIGEEYPTEDEDSIAVLKVFETGRPISSLNTQMAGTGRKRSVQTRSYPIFGSAGEVIAVVETLMDITESLRLEKDLEKRVKELEEFYDMAVGRELRMMELKEEIERLREEISKKSSQ